MPQPETGGGGGPANGILPLKLGKVQPFRPPFTTTYLADGDVDDATAQRVFDYLKAMRPDAPLTLKHGIVFGWDAEFPIWHVDVAQFMGIECQQAAELYWRRTKDNADDVLANVIDRLVKRAKKGK